MAEDVSAWSPSIVRAAIRLQVLLDYCWGISMVPDARGSAGESRHWTDRNYNGIIDRPVIPLVPECMIICPNSSLVRNVLTEFLSPVQVLQLCT